MPFHRPTRDVLSEQNLKKSLIKGLKINTLYIEIVIENMIVNKYLKSMFWRWEFNKIQKKYIFRTWFHPFIEIKI